MKHFSTRSRITILSGLFLLMSKVLLAAPPPPGGGGTPPCWPPPCIPVDKGVVFLVIAGIGLAGWKLYASFRRKQA
jgi:hypothetical protein